MPIKEWNSDLIGPPLHDPVTWYKITYTGEQVAQWDLQNKGRSHCFVSPTVQLADQYM